ncbi:hypothetical protein ACEWY4_000214 [Coilia grayii]|uniref:Transposase domain-containing protein n=1 Tax=Coilia grayii TaxID=363190 RepID=A0ABD1KVZ7_9TELE
MEVDEIEMPEPTLKEELSEWACNFGITHNALDALLKVLQRQGHTELPSTARTLLQTERKFKVDMIGGVETIKYDVADQLKLHLSKYAPDTTKDLQSINISLNIDGLPLFKSSNKSLWPILCSINLTPKCIFPLSLSTASSKPKDITFINDITSQLSKIMQDGLEWMGRSLKVHLECITCHAPAKAMVRCVKLFSGYYGCDKCDQKGVWDGRMLFPEVENLTLRTNQSFRECWQPEHHQAERTSPFCSLPIDMVKSFPADYMHHCCLGVMRKLLLLWTRGKTTVRLSRAQMAVVNEHLMALRKVIPTCFGRKPRVLDDLDRWKATEFRQFLLYTGKIVMQGVLRGDLFDHFMAFSTAMCILVSPVLARSQHQYAHELLKFFVEQGEILYGPRFLVYNVHSLLHLAADVSTLGCLDNFSAFPFESKLCQIKKMTRSGKNPLVQIANRLEENIKMKLMNERCTTPKLRSTFMLSNRECCEIVSAGRSGVFLCRVYTHLEPYLLRPCDSRIYGTFKGNIRSTEMRDIDERALVRRAFIVEEDHGSRVIVTILHTL